jgi:DUF4097 and DUF4098 domain-containing protein YvlB
MRSSIRIAVSVAVFFAVTGLVCGQGWQEYEERFDRSVVLRSDGEVSLGNIAGDIEINTWNLPEVQIMALKVSRARTMEEAARNAADVDIEVIEREGSVQIQTHYPRNSREGMNVAVYYTLNIPAYASVDVSSVSGAIRLSECGGNAHLKSVSGGVEAYGVAGRADVQSVSGHVRASRVNGEVRVKSVSGNVVVESSEGEVAAETVSGRVDVLGLSGAGFNLDASTFSGRINSDFNLGALSGMGRDHVKASINGGGKSVRLRTLSGDLNLK